MGVTSQAMTSHASSKGKELLLDYEVVDTKKPLQFTCKEFQFVYSDMYAKDEPTPKEVDAFNFFMDYMDELRGNKKRYKGWQEYQSLKRMKNMERNGWKYNVT